jgi:hypothetical protein
LCFFFFPLLFYSYITSSSPTSLSHTNLHFLHLILRKTLSRPYFLFIFFFLPNLSSSPIVFMFFSYTLFVSSFFLSTPILLCFSYPTIFFSNSSTLLSSFPYSTFLLLLLLLLLLL